MVPAVGGELSRLLSAPSRPNLWLEESTRPRRFSGAVNLQRCNKQHCSLNGWCQARQERLVSRSRKDSRLAQSEYPDTGHAGCPDIRHREQHALTGRRPCFRCPPGPVPEPIADLLGVEDKLGPRRGAVGPSPSWHANRGLDPSPVKAHLPESMMPELAPYDLSALHRGPRRPLSGGRKRRKGGEGAGGSAARPQVRVEGLVFHLRWSAVPRGRRRPPRAVGRPASPARPPRPHAV